MGNLEQFRQELIADKGEPLDVDEVLKLAKKLSQLDHGVFPGSPIPTEIFTQRGVDVRTGDYLWRPAYYTPKSEDGPGKYGLIAGGLHDASLQYGKWVIDHITNGGGDNFKKRQYSLLTFAAHEVRHRIQDELHIREFRKNDTNDLPEPVQRALAELFPDYDERFAKEQRFGMEFDATVVEFLVAHESYYHRPSEQALFNLLRKGLP